MLLPSVLRGGDPTSGTASYGCTTVSPAGPRNHRLQFANAFAL